MMYDYTSVYTWLRSWLGGYCVIGFLANPLRIGDARKKPDLCLCPNVDLTQQILFENWKNVVEPLPNCNEL